MSDLNTVDEDEMEKYQESQQLQSKDIKEAKS